MSDKTLIVEGLSIAFEGRNVVRDLSFTLAPGRCVALVGESGSGKSVSARSLVGLAGSRAEVAARRLSFGEHDLLALSERQWRGVRGKDIGFVLQDALVSLDPLRPVGKEILEVLETHGFGNRQQRGARVLELLERVGVPDVALRARQRSGQLSGGLRQRALIASALAMDPALVIADEPTTALDATVQAQILEVFQQIKARGASLLIISHDLAVVAQLADDVVVLRHGEVVEQGPMLQVLSKPQHPYTRELLAAVPSEHPRGSRLSGVTRPTSPVKSGEAGHVLLQAQGLGKRYLGPDGQLRQVVQDVGFELRAGQTLGIVGESGSGKTTVARIALGLLQPDAGQVLYRGHPWNLPGNAIDEKRRRPLRREISVIYQDPLGSFDPRWNVMQILDDALHVAGVEVSQRPARITHLLGQVRLPPELALRRPLQLSGGQRQRVAIARAIASEPKLIICDEPVSALDVSVQAQVLDLLADLQQELGLAYLFISHDLGVIRHVSDNVLVMRHGQVVELAPAEQLFTRPAHEYTQRLLGSVPCLPGSGAELVVPPLDPEHEAFDVFDESRLWKIAI
ncbi:MULTISPECIES: dipeptide ABC transporter ATP-binding protein [Pseudomonas]|uniref:ABC transporter ATP-binding protein n=1 Tax=Pseudomonas cichorii TaxID=36746 RepID=A0ABQ1DSM3_PSECI|nr:MULTISPECIES: ABC transporter ATP-binding protein [Pseudomonas]AHF67771.1 ATPase component of various ABC-type transport system with duplicated ATPase domain protein [Pseudomonas cichorii JBC1]QVE14859.1 ABC transporter ATP-binding protein [Pseudomonas cichorii]SDO94374.1 peptide/nickel transport system ATP-binding protein [Pseudomonas cichorii]GFM76963.1 ABC transporter ATP-binding protein [Pseudomonas cichorii]GFM94033.1 ABC transporter ATP-binding protein [Pseudomonas cichorii]